MRVLVTGGAGFIGSNLAITLEQDGHEVRIFDNFSTGKVEFLQNFKGKIIIGDLLTDRELLFDAIKGVDEIYHLAANADVKNGWKNPKRDLEQNLIATINVLEVASELKVPEIIFSSTGSIYGTTVEFPTPEEAKMPLQTSLYGASKLSAESFIQAYCEAKKIRATIFRFVSILGPHYTHGHIRDFFVQLNTHPEYLDVLGDGYQNKSYLHIKDCIAAISNIRSNSNCDIFNLGLQETITVRESIEVITDFLSLNPKINYGESKNGWIGDNPFILLDTSKARSLGWKPNSSIRTSIIDTLSWLSSNQKLIINT